MSLRPLLVSAACALVLPLSSCGWTEHICSEGDYPTWRPDGPGATCYPEGKDPAPGYVRYPAGDVPDALEDSYRPLRRYPELRPWAKEYVAWLEDGHRGDPPVMPDVVEEPGQNSSTDTEA